MLSRVVCGIARENHMPEAKKHKSKSEIGTTTAGEVQKTHKKMQTIA
jgi:hypothetical protein